MSRMADPEGAVRNMRENCANWFHKTTPFLGLPAHGRDFVPVCGGPSIKARLREIRARRFIGGCVVACNGANLFLRANGITPDAVAFIDPSEAVHGFIDDDGDSTYLVASICHPSVFERLHGRNVVMWHADIGMNECGQILDLFPEIPTSLVGGGNTIGLRMLNLGYVRGFRNFHFYGLDGSYADDGSDHAYTKHDGPEDGKVMKAKFQNKEYTGSSWMIEQAGIFFDELYPEFASKGCKIYVHGEGLIPDMCKAYHKFEKSLAA